MAYVAATATHLSVMPAHIWQSHPRSPTSPNSSADAAQDLASAGPILASSAASLSLPPPLPLPPASTQAVWSARPAPSHPGPVDLTASPLPPLRAHPQQSSAVDPDAQGDANSLLFDILKLRIDEQSTMSQTAVASGAPFHSAATSHSLQPAPRVAVPPMHDLHMDHRGTHRPLFMQTPTSDLVPLHDPVGAIPMRASFATPLRADNGNMPALRTSSVLRQPGGPPSAPSMIHASASPAAQSNQATPRIKNELYKTEICRSFSETGGFCKYGSKCQFAHGDAELRPVRRHPRYKTKQCRNYITTGSCPYGARCRFIHATDPPYNQPTSHATAASGASIAPSPASVMGHQALPHLHHSQRSDQVRHMESGEKYADDLQGFMNTNSSSATSAHHVEDLIEAMNIESGVAGTSLSGGRVEKVVTSSMPANRVYRANAHAFQSYGGSNVFYNHYMHLGGSENDLLYPTADFAENPHVQADRNPLKPSDSYGAAGSGVEISRRFETPGPERDRSDAFTHPDSGHSSTSPPTQVLSTAAGPAESSSCASMNGESSRLPSSSPQVSRSRLPVFRNMAFGSDDQH